MSDQKPFNQKHRQRWMYTPDELRILEESFLKYNGYPDCDTVDKLALQLNLGDRRVRVWFQNRRAKSRRRSAPNLLEKQAPLINLRRRTNESAKPFNKENAFWSETRDRLAKDILQIQSQDIPPLALANGKDRISTHTKYEFSHNSDHIPDEADQPLDLRIDKSSKEKHLRDRKRHSIAAVETLHDVSEQTKQHGLKRARKKRRTSAPTDVTRENQKKQKDQKQETEPELERPRKKRRTSIPTDISKESQANKIDKNQTIKKDKNQTNQTDNKPLQKQSRRTKQTHFSLPMILPVPSEHPSTSVTTDANSPMSDEPLTPSTTMTNALTNTSPPVSQTSLETSTPTLPSTHVHESQMQNSFLNQEHMVDTPNTSSELTTSSSPKQISSMPVSTQDAESEPLTTMVLPLTSPKPTEDAPDTCSPDSGECGLVISQVCSIQETWCQVLDENVPSWHCPEVQSEAVVEEIDQVMDPIHLETRETPDTNSEDEDQRDTGCEPSIPDSTSHERPHLQEINNKDQQQNETEYEQSTNMDTAYEQTIHSGDTGCEHSTNRDTGYEQTIHSGDTGCEYSTNRDTGYGQSIHKEVAKDEEVTKINDSSWPNCSILPVPDDVVIMYISYRNSELETESCVEDSTPSADPGSDCVVAGIEESIRLPVLLQ